jgi:imidazole glycerol phosphate synthase subunit HisF
LQTVFETFDASEFKVMDIKAVEQERILELDVVYHCTATLAIPKCALVVDM